MWPRHRQQPLLATAATLGCLLAIILVQPALSSASTDTPAPSPATQNATRGPLVSDSSSAKELNKQPEEEQPSVASEVIEGFPSSLGSEVPEEPDFESLTTEREAEFVGVPGFLPTVLPPRTPDTPTNGHGYIQFEVNEELPVEVVRRQKPIQQTVTRSRTDTVNEVLSNLFPNGFSDIFRFSGKDTNTEPATTTATTTNKAVVRPTVEAITTTEASTTETPSVGKAPNETYYSYQTTVTKEYRRELRPGHTEIVVEQIREPGFRDGSNHISRDELLRINRAAVAAPVLPSVLLRPEGDDNETLVAAESAPIVILGEHDVEVEENTEIEDNQIAETRHVGREAYQQRLPAPSHNDIESYANQKGPGQDQEINVHIVHDATLGKSQEGEGKATPEKSQPQIQPQIALDHYQAHSEQRFKQHHQSHEAPSRQFLKSFKPIVSGSGEGPLPKGSFHYEVQNPPQLPSSRPPKEGNYAGHFTRPAAQLEYQQELSQVLPQVQQELPHQQPQQQSYQPLESLYTKAIASPSPEVQHYSGYAGPTPVSATPNSLVFVTLNTPSPPHSSPAPAPAHAHASHEPGVDITVHHPAPHDYVSEAAAEPSQQHVQHAPAPAKSHSSQPNGYTFVEVQKSVNIHNKLITEKDGRLVEQHETIYHQPYLHSPVPPAIAPAPAPTKDYASLAKNPIHVEYDSSPQEVAISHATVHLDTGHPGAFCPASAQQTVHPGPIYAPAHQEHIQGNKVIHQEHHIQHDHHPEHQEHQIQHEHHSVIHEPHQEHHHHLEHHEPHYPVDKLKQVVEKHIPVPYAVPQPVPVPVHVEHYVDRPYPVETIVEHAVPYPVPTVVEKIVEKHVPVEVERIVEKPVHVEKIVEKFVDRPMAIPIHVPVAIHMPMPPSHSSLPFGHHGHPNALAPWSHSVAHIPPKVLQNYYTRMLKKLLPQLTAKAPLLLSQSPSKAIKLSKPVVATANQPVKPVRGEAPKVATFSLADMRFDLRPPPPPLGSPWLQGARYIYNTLPADLATAAASAPTQMVKSYIGPVPATSSSGGVSDSSLANEFDEFQRWRNGHSLKRSPDFGRNLQLEYGFKPPLVPSMEIDDKGNPLKQAEPSESQ
ncbi:LOW QUALITY PROTEIN: uncharacterized protein LOC110189331 [Drosophila serrata]|uniref:LOW QUALITY PROTEIN: uncharacterized protein LOC110189331 n=1 Tax=Drosophila serrata TaxID=7274 RepID=UPI000A1D26A7|nr:LOW QUALITY PROTEIN: uncharacterized protein LOC110189331 [Drosophila serrata]